MTEWDGHERRKGWQDMEVQLAEIKGDVKFIRSNMESYKRELDFHIQEDNKIHTLVTTHGAQITMLMWLFLAMIGVGVWKFALASP